MLNLEWWSTPVDQTSAWTWTDSSTNATDWTQTANNQTNPETTNANNDKVTTKDAWAEIRYQISRERELRKQAEARAKELEEKLNTPAPKFDTDTDPDGSKEIEYRAREIARKEYEEMMKKSWLDEKLQKIQYEQEIDNFSKHVDSVASETFWKFWIKVSKDEIVSTMQQLDEKWITPLQIALLAKAQDVIAKMKPDTISPWEWSKANAWNRQLSQEEINANIYKQFWAFGH